DRLLHRERATLACRGVRPGLLDQRSVPSFFQGELGEQVVVLHLIEAVLGETVSVEPDRIAGRGGRELPEDRRLAATLAVTLEVVVEEAFGEPRPNLATPRVQQRRRFLPECVSIITEGHVEDVADGTCEITKMSRVVD